MRRRRTKTMKQTTNDAHEQELEQLRLKEALHPHVKVFVNLFYELMAINEYLLPHVEDGLKLLQKGFRFNDKKIFGEIVRHATEIRKLNDRLNEPFWENLPSVHHTMMRRDANDIVRVLLLIIDRVGSDPLKFAQLEEWLQMMPSTNLISDDILDRFHLQ